MNGTSDGGTLPPFFGRDASVNGAPLSTFWAHARSDSDNASSVAAACKTSSSGFENAALGWDSAAVAATAPSATRRRSHLPKVGSSTAPSQDVDELIKVINDLCKGASN